MINSKEFSIDNLVPQILKWKSEHTKVVFTNGVFDILHLGHVTYLQKARELGDKLVVGINTDASVRRLNKGPERPIHDEYARAKVLLALKCVDAVVLFDDDTPLQIIERIQPDILVKGGDYDPNETNSDSKKYIVGSRETKSHGGTVCSIDLVDGYSTTQAVHKILKQND